MSLSTINAIKETAMNLSSTVQDTLLSAMICNAEMKIRRWIGDIQYDYFAAVLRDNQELDLTKATVLRNAEIQLVLYYLIQNANVVVTSQGIVTSANSKNFGDATFQTATPNQIDQMKAQFFATAEELTAGFTPDSLGVLPVFRGEQ